ncbi:MAG: Dot/Icm type IV secretion system ATPase DotB [Legionellales bacterium]|jgi:defect in organelle trafficking protein DotB|nr:Dot/Icm type IV secretion system ATPase DotB [Legionellales bacterium]
MDSDNNDTNELTDSIDNNRADNLEKNVEDPEIHAQLNDYLLPNEPRRITPNDVDIILEHCCRINTSDITIQTNEHIFAEIYGRLCRITKRKLNNSEVGSLLNSIYGPNGTTQILSGNDIDTNYEFKPNRLDRYRFRVNGTGCLVSGHDGIQITLRTIPSTPPSLSTMDLPDNIKKYIAPEQGVIYITGATGSGKSTLLASIISDIAAEPKSNRKILTYESPIEFVYDDIEKTTAVVSQSEIPLHIPSFAAGVRNALRRKPRLILVGEARDQETISSVLEAALTGHPVYTTMHTNGVAETIRRLVGTFPKEERAGKTIDLIETVRLIIWQKLVPTVDKKRVALREYLVFNDTVRDMLLEVDHTRITEKTREVLKSHGQTMISDAKAKYDAKIISADIFKTLARGTEYEQE